MLQGSPEYSLNNVSLDIFVPAGATAFVPPGPTLLVDWFHLIRQPAGPINLKNLHYHSSKLGV